MGACVGRAGVWSPPTCWAILGAYNPRAMRPNEGYVTPILITDSDDTTTTDNTLSTDEAVV